MMSNHHGARALAAGAAADMIGQELAGLRASFLASATQLTGLLPEKANAVVTSAIAEVQSQICRIALIGQVKAGKSSLLNALVRRPGLLPTDPNPWTAAVTHAHFAIGSREPERTIFEFFSAEEWHRFADEGGPLRELTERLVPGFEADKLKRQFQLLRDRARDRLGADFEGLLGATHSFETVSGGLLEQYVCTNALLSPSQRARDVGRFAEITKAAHLYLNSGPFAFPSTIIDTPGTNDPLLVRDEITRQSLQAADILIVVLTAQQMLSPTDVSLLRILRGLSKDRIIFFINRIDNLGEIYDESMMVREAIRRRLIKEFSFPDISIVLGSAAWANAAITPQLGQADFLSSSAFKAYVRQARLVDANAGWLGRFSGGLPTGQGRALLQAASGLDALSFELSRMMLKSHAGARLQALSENFLALARANEAVVREELNTQLNRQTVETNRTSQQTAAEIARITDEIARLEAVGARLQVVLDRLAADFGDIKARTRETLPQPLAQIVHEFAAAERLKLAQPGTNPQTWRCDIAPLRSAIDAAFRAAAEQAARAMEQAQARAAADMDAIFAEAAPLVGGAAALAGHRWTPEPPSLAPLSRLVAFDLDSSWWSLWLADQPDPRQREALLERLIVSEFQPVIDQLQTSGQIWLDNAGQDVLQRLIALALGFVEILGRRRSEFAAAREQLLSAPPETPPAALLARDERLAAYEHYAQGCRQAFESFRRLMDGWAEAHRSLSLK